MAVAARFCGTCGAQLPLGAPFCGRCGATVQAPPVVAPPAYAYPYAYPSAQAPQAQGWRRFGMTQLAIAAGLLIVLAVTTLAVTAFAVSRALGDQQPCTSNCGAKLIPALPETHTYHSSAYRFDVDYSSKWTVRSQSSDGVVLGTKKGTLLVTGSRTGPSNDQVVLATVGALQTSEWQSVTRVSDLKGAHIGDQDGVGAVYGANLIGTNGKATKVRFVVIAASRNGVTVVVFGINPADPSNYPNGIPEGQAFDYLLQEFRWN